MGDVMRAFSESEIRYLGGRRLGRLATVGTDGCPDVVPVAFRYNPELGAIDIEIDIGIGIGGRRSAEAREARDVRQTGVAALLVDDATPAGRPGRPRAVQVCGDAVTVTPEVGGRPGPGGKAERQEAADPIIRLSPRRIVSWGLEPGAPRPGPKAAPRLAGWSRLRRSVAVFDDVRVWVAFLAALFAWLVAFLLTTRVFDNWETSRLAVVLTAWACAGSVYVLVTLGRFLPVEPERLRDRLELEDEDQLLTGHMLRLWTYMIFVAAIIFTIVGLQLGPADQYTKAAALAAVIASWFAIHALHAEYYAYQYYSPDQRNAFFFPDDSGQRGAHGFLDFAYLALAIGSTFGTTDVKLHGERMRRAVMLHVVLSVWFNVGVIAAVVALALS
jgi:pyridoxamine 5'-phosphate oxidase family protein